MASTAERRARSGSLPSLAQLPLPLTCVGAILLAACSEDKPYVPWTVGASASESASAAIEPSAAPPPAGSFAAAMGTPPPGDPRSFPLGGGSITARSGRVFKKGLVFDADGDQRDDLFAWTSTSAGAKGELVFYAGADAPVELVLAKLPVELDIGDCSPDAALKRVGHGVVAALVTATCGDAKERHQFVAVGRVDRSAEAAARRPPEGRLTATAKAPLSLEVSAMDRDSDGLEDLVLTARLAEPELEGVEATLVLWDRPTGYAWDPAEPEASLGKLGQALLARAVAKKPDASARARGAVRLARSLCTDLGGAKLTTSAGAPRCQETRLMGDAIHTIALAASHAGDVPLVLAGAEAVAGLRFDFGRVPQIEGLVAKKVKKVDATVVLRPAAKASTSGPGTLSPLAFDASGGLAIAGDSEVVRVDLATGREDKSDVAPWSRVVSWVDGDATLELTGASRQCSPPSVSIATSARGSATSAEVPVFGSLTPSVVQKDKCEKGAVDLATLGVGERGPVLAVGGELLRASFGDQGVTYERATMPSGAGATTVMGGAVSGDGKSAVLTLPRSLLVHKNGAWERWKSDATAGLTRCVVSNLGDRVACLSTTGVVVLGAKGK